MAVLIRMGQRGLLRWILGSAVAFFLLCWLNPNWLDRSIHHVRKFDTAVDVSKPQYANPICKSHGWAPFSGVARRKVYDLIMINTELDWLEIRLNTTYHYVDYFVIVESSKTFTNLDKPLVVKQNLDRFAAYRDKIIYHELDIPADFHSDRSNPAWDFEDLQRDAMFKQAFPLLQGPQVPHHGDVIIVADVDELIRPETLLVLRACSYPRRLTLRSDMYYYSYQFLHKGRQWQHPQATYFEGPRTILPTNLRNSDGGFPPFVSLEKADLWNSGWHCSSCFSTIEDMLNKLSSFSHVSLNQDAYRDPDRIASRVREGKDLWDRPGEEYKRIDNNHDIPRLLLDSPDKFPYLMDRSGPSAGFQDYPKT